MAECAVDTDLLFLLRHTRARLSDDAFAILRVVWGGGALLPRAGTCKGAVCSAMNEKENELRKGSF